MEKKLLGYYNYTVVLTYIGMIAGFIGIINVMDSRISNAIICLMISGLCDMFDGAIASTMERTQREKGFGIQIDSLSDLICFGVLPGVISFKMSKHAGGIALFVSALYVLCALIRLAYFNVDEEERQRRHSCPREIYYGLPVTLVALVLPLCFFAFRIFSVDSRFILLPVSVSAILFLLPVPLKKPKLIGKIVIMVCGGVEMILFSYTSWLGLMA